MQTVRTSAHIWTAVVLVIILLAGCTSRDRVTKPLSDGPYLPNNSESNLLSNLTTAYTMKDIDAYIELFAWDRFHFVFDAADVEDNPAIDPSWTWPDDLKSARNLFESPLVLEIKLEFDKGPVVGPPETDPPSPGPTRITVTNVELEIDTIDPLGGEDIVFKVAGDRGKFFFRNYPDELIDGQPRVRIVEWRDERVGPLPVERITWGRVKFHYWLR